MSDGSLSQDEIDALLQGADPIQADADPQASEDGLSEQEIGVLQPIFVEIAESQSSTLSMLAQKTVVTESPSIELCTTDQLIQELSGEVVDVKIDFTEGIEGEHGYIVDLDSATKIAGAMMGQEQVELNDAALQAVAEAVSQLTGPTSTTIGDKTGRTILMNPPEALRVDSSQVRLPAGESFVKVQYPFSFDGVASSPLTEVYSLALLKEAAGLAGAAGAAGAEGSAVLGGSPAQPPAAAQPGEGDPLASLGGDAAGQPGLAGLGGQPAAGGLLGSTMGPPSVQPVQFPDLQAAGPAGDQGNIGLLMDVSMELTVELGRTRKPIKEILGLGEGTIIELDKLAGEPVDILVNHKPIAKGEVVVIDENFGVRVTEIVSSAYGKI